MTAPICCACELPIHPDEVVEMENPYTGTPDTACRCCKEDAEREAEAAYREQQQVYNAGISGALSRHNL